MAEVAERAEELAVDPLGVLRGVGEEETLLVGDDGHLAIAAIVLAAAHVDAKVCALHVLGEVLTECPVQSRILRARGEDEGRGGRRVGKEVGEKAEHFVTRRGALLRLVGRVEGVGDDAVDVAPPQAALLRETKCCAERRDLSLDRRVQHALRAPGVDVPPDGRRVFEQRDAEVVPQDADEVARLLSVEAHGLRGPVAVRDAGLAVFEEQGQGVVEGRRRGCTIGISGFALPLGENGPSCRLVRAARRSFAGLTVEVDRRVPDRSPLAEVHPSSLSPKWSLA